MKFWKEDGDGDAPPVFVGILLDRLLFLYVEYGLNSRGSFFTCVVEGFKAESSLNLVLALFACYC